MANVMASRKIMIILFLGLFLILNRLPASAQNSPPKLSLLYSNNIWGEIDPCPV